MMGFRNKNFIVFLFVILGFLGTVIFLTFTKNLPNYLFVSPSSVISQSKPETQKANIFLNPKKGNFYKNQEFTVEVLINTVQPILGLNLDINYDPEVLEVKNISAGDFFSSPLEIKKEVGNGKIIYALGSLSPSSGENVVARLLLRGKKTELAKLEFTGETKAVGKEGEVYLEPFSEVKYFIK